MRALGQFFRLLARKWRNKEPLFGLPNWLVGICTLHFRRCGEPDFVVYRDDGSVYLVRRWILPRNPVFNIYLHHFQASDDPRALHDHPWLNVSILLRGAYNEHVAQLRALPTPHERLWFAPKVVKTRRAPWIGVRRAISSHRLELVTPTAWTLFVTGPVFRSWGFHCKQGWVHWRAFLAPGDKGRTGAGCGE